MTMTVKDHAILLKNVLNVEENELVSKVLQSCHERLGYLYGRWQDEKEYEEWSDYAMVMQKMAEPLQPLFRIIRYSKRPFGIVFKTRRMNNPTVYVMYADSKHVGWKAIR